MGGLAVSVTPYLGHGYQSVVISPIMASDNGLDFDVLVFFLFRTRLQNYRIFIAG